MSSSTRTPRSIALLILAIALPAAAAWWSTGRAAGGALVSDDLLIPALFLEAGEDGTEAQVRWDEVQADFGRRWLGLDAPLYRPMVSVSLAMDIERSDPGSGVDNTDEMVGILHATNRWLHVWVTVASALLVAVCAGAGTPIGVVRATAALGSGLLVALHPISVECVAWIAARNSSLEVGFRMLALVAFALAIRPTSSRWLRRSLVGSAIFGAALALGTKESAVALVPSVVLLDLLVRGAPRFEDIGTRVRQLLPLVLVFAGYVALRLALFGLDQTGDSTESISARIGMVSKLRALLLNGQPVDSLEGALTGTGFLLLLVPVMNLARTAILTLWIFLLFLPTLHKGVSADLVGSRFVYGIVPVLAFVAATAAVRERASRIRAASSLLGLGLVLAGSVMTSAERYDAYEEAWAAQDRLFEAASAIPDGRVAIAAMPTTPAGLPPFNQNNWFLALQPPFADREGAIFGLGHQVVPVPGSEDLLEDTRIERILLDAGIPVLNLVEAPDGSVTVQRLDRTNRPPIGAPIELALDASGTATFPTEVKAFGFDLIRVEVADDGLSPGSNAVRAIEVGLPAIGPEVPESLRFRLRTEPDGSRTADLRPSLWITALGTYARPLRNIRVPVLDGESALEGGTVRLERIPVVDWSEAQRKALPIGVGATPTITLPAEPPDANWLLHVVGPHTTFRLTGRSGETVGLPEARLRDLRLAFRMARTNEVLLSAETASGRRVVTEPVIVPVMVR